MIQIGAASFEVVSRLVEGDNGDVLMGSLVDCTGEPWSKQIRYPNAPEKARHTRSVFCNLMLMQSISAFDHFTVHLLRDLCCFSSTARSLSALNHRHTPFVKSAPSGKLPPCCMQKVGQFCRKASLGIRIEKIQNALGLTHSDVQGLLPLFHFHRLLRNTVAHANGFPGAELLTMNASQDLMSSFRCWNGLTKKAAPPLYSPTAGTTIELQARHAVLANAVCFHIAKRLTTMGLGLIDDDGMLEMATYYALFEPVHAFRNKKASSPEAEVNHFLHSRYLVKHVDAQETVTRLKSAGLWTIVRDQHAKRYPNGVLCQ